MGSKREGLNGKGGRIMKDSFANVLFLVVLVFMMASIYAVNHEESAIIADNLTKGAENARR